MSDLFERYPALPATVRAQGTALARSGNAMSAVADDAASAATAAADSLEGDLDAPTRALAGPLSTQGVQLRGAAGFAGAAMTMFSAAIAAYNATIDTLNQEYDAAAPSARDAKAADLSRRRLAAEAVLDAEAEDAAGMLQRGPNAVDWTTFETAGALPVGYAPYAGGGGSGPATVEQMEARLRAEGLLDGPDPAGYYLRWLQNAAKRGVSVDTVVDIARTHELDPDDFKILDGLEEVKDPDGKSYFLLPTGISGKDARKAVLMTYILNAGTDYGTADGGTRNDFPETPYSSDEIQRIIDRQSANNWFSYGQDVGFVNGNGGRLSTTPNGMLMGLGGNGLQDLYSANGGTTFGDIFMLNIDDPDDPRLALREVIETGTSAYEDDGQVAYDPNLDLDRLLHHEERHSQQWASEGYFGFIAGYADEATDVVWKGWGPFGVPWIEQVDGKDNSYEQDAGLHDGGYQ